MSRGERHGTALRSLVPSGQWLVVVATLGVLLAAGYRIFIYPLLSRVPKVENMLDRSFVEAGPFEMGSDDGESDETPVRMVQISRGFWMGKYEVTQKEYRELMEGNPSFFRSDDLPVEQVSWEDALKFCEELTRKEKEAGRLPPGLVYRLPTEAEWEYAARGGSLSRGYTYSGGNDLAAVGWFSQNSRRKPHPVGRKQANELGLYDIHGNVWEWCLDWYVADLGTSALTDPAGAASGSDRVGRGGGWDYDAGFCRSALRGYVNPDYRGSLLGFRLAMTLP